MDELTERYRLVLWKTKRLLDDLPWDNDIDHYVISEEKYKILTRRINRVLFNKEKKKNGKS